MAANKEHPEVRTVDLDRGWEAPPGCPVGIKQGILAGPLDEERGRGASTGLLRFGPA